MQFPTLLIAALALAAFSSAAAGCGGGSPLAGVANVGTTSTTTGRSDRPSSRDEDHNGKNPAEFSACMRAHGVRNFPDPSPDGGIRLQPGNGIDPDSATFRAAQRACDKNFDVKPPSAAEQQQAQEQALRFSQCMRQHGVPKFPDPQFSGGRATLKLDRRNGIDPKSPQFKAAFKACEKLTPGMKQGPDERVGPGGGQTQSSGGPAS